MFSSFGARIHTAGIDAKDSDMLSLELLGQELGKDGPRSIRLSVCANGVIRLAVLCITRHVSNLMEPISHIQSKRG